MLPLALLIVYHRAHLTELSNRSVVQKLMLVSFMRAILRVKHHL